MLARKANGYACFCYFPFRRVNARSYPMMSSFDTTHWCARQVWCSHLLSASACRGPLSLEHRDLFWFSSSEVKGALIPQAEPQERDVLCPASAWRLWQSWGQKPGLVIPSTVLPQYHCGFYSVHEFLQAVLSPRQTPQSGTWQGTSRICLTCCNSSRSCSTASVRAVL